MEKPKNSSQNITWQQTILYIFLSLVVIFACFLSQFIGLYFEENIIPWTFLPEAFPNATMMYTDKGSMGNSSSTLSWYYCTDASIEDLQVFFEPKVDAYQPYNYNVEGFTPHSGYHAYFREQMSNILSDSFWEHSPHMTLLLRRTHPDCSNAAYRITIIYPSEY